MPCSSLINWGVEKCRKEGWLRQHQGNCSRNLPWHSETELRQRYLIKIYGLLFWELTFPGTILLAPVHIIPTKIPGQTEQGDSNLGDSQSWCINGKLPSGPGASERCLWWRRLSAEGSRLQDKAPKRVRVVVARLAAIKMPHCWFYLEPFSSGFIN